MARERYIEDRVIRGLVADASRVPLEAEAILRIGTGTGEGFLPQAVRRTVRDKGSIVPKPQEVLPIEEPFTQELGRVRSKLRAMLHPRSSKYFFLILSEISYNLSLRLAYDKIF